LTLNAAARASSWKLMVANMHSQTACNEIIFETKVSRVKVIASFVSGTTKSTKI
jgi:hypothetical protein